MARIIQDEHGKMTIDEQGYAHRGPEYARRYSQLEAMSGGLSGWRREGTGFATVYPVHSAAYRKVVQRLVELDRVRTGAPSATATSKAITADSSPLYGEWTCDDWITWHRALVKKTSEAEADLRWRDAWLEGLSREVVGNRRAPGSMFAFDVAPIDRNYTDNFQEYITARPTLYSAVNFGVSTRATDHAHEAINPHQARMRRDFAVGEVPGPPAKRSTVGTLAAAGLVAGGAYLWWKSKNEREEDEWAEEQAARDFQSRFGYGRGGGYG